MIAYAQTYMAQCWFALWNGGSVFATLCREIVVPGESCSTTFVPQLGWLQVVPCNQIGKKNANE